MVQVHLSTAPSEFGTVALFCPSSESDGRTSERNPLNKEQLCTGLNNTDLTAVKPLY